MPEDQPGQTDAENLARKLQALEAKLSIGEQRLLTRVLATAALFGIAIETGEAIGAGAPGQLPPTMSESLVDLGAQRWDDIGAQFHDSFTPGEAWETPSNISVKPPR